MAESKEILEQPEKLGRLKADGILTEEEFLARKNELMGKK